MEIRPAEVLHGEIPEKHKPGEDAFSPAEVNEANARLIAQAPAMLECLQRMRSNIEMGNLPRNWDADKTLDMLIKAMGNVG